MPPLPKQVSLKTSFLVLSHGSLCRKVLSIQDLDTNILRCKSMKYQTKLLKHVKNSLVQILSRLWVFWIDFLSTNALTGFEFVSKADSSINPNTCQHNLHIPLTLLSLITHNIWISAYCSSKGISKYFCLQHFALRETILSSQGPFSGLHIFA